MTANSEQLYRDGVGRWAARDLDGAVDLLAASLAASAGPDADPWWFAATRALAQVALERDDPDVAELHLVRLPGDLVGDAQTHALRARLALLRGDHGSAELCVGMAVLMLAYDQEREIGALMNGAIALASCAEVLVELGYGVEGARLVDQALGRISRAGIHDEVVASWLSLDAASAARLQGDHELATVELAGVDPEAGDDFGVRVARERARLAWEAGRLGEADRWYAQAIAEADTRHHPALRRSIEEERVGAPPVARLAEHPVERWIEATMGADLPPAPEEATTPYAVVLTLVAADDPDLGRFEILEQRIDELLAARPEVGYVDGSGLDGNLRVWELFLDGDDPELLWSTVRPLVDAIVPARGSQATIRHDDGSWRIEPLAAPL